MITGLPAFTDVTRETPVKVFSHLGADYIVEKAEAETAGSSLLATRFTSWGIQICSMIC